MTKSGLIFVLFLGGVPLSGSAEPFLQGNLFGESLGGWEAKRGRAAEYEITGAHFRTWRPHVTPTVDGGIFVSVRIDHLRGFLASDDHASLELNFDRDGEIVSAQSTIALQGRKITSDVVQGSTRFGTDVAGVDRMAMMGTDLVASLTAKLLREKVAEPGRVGFPAAVRHNYNLLCLAINRGADKAVPVDGPDGAVPPVDQGAEVGEVVTDQAQKPVAGEPANGDARPADVARKPAPELKIHQQGKPAKTTKPIPIPTKG